MRAVLQKNSGDEVSSLKGSEIIYLNVEMYQIGSKIWIEHLCKFYHTTTALQVRDARAALDALREEEKERRRLEAEHAERIRQAQVCVSLSL